MYNQSFIVITGRFSTDQMICILIIMFAYLNCFIISDAFTVVPFKFLMLFCSRVHISSKHVGNLLI